MKTYEEMLGMAKVLATSVHASHHYGNKPYILHVMRVVDRLEKLHYGPEYITVAWLHDVLEDSNVKIDDLRALGFSFLVLQAVEALTKLEYETYEDYIARVNEGSWSRVVKLADIEDHLSQRHAQSFRKYDQYMEAREVLSI